MALLEEREMTMLSKYLLEQKLASNNYTDALREKLLPEHFGAKEDTFIGKQTREEAFIHEMDEYNFHACIAYVNVGVNDFNAASKEKCPSLFIGKAFDQYYKMLLDPPSLNSTKFFMCRANDLLYIYRKLKVRGLNTKVLANYPETQEIFKTMDKILAQPEQERFLDRSPLVGISKHKGILGAIKREIESERILSRYDDAF